MLSKSNATGYWIYVWDYENRLTTASTRKQTVRYRYDALGRRVQRYFGRGGNGENTKFIYDGLDVVMDDNSGVLTKYQHELGIDNKLKMVTSGQATYFLQDHLGSTVGLADSSGAVVSSASYDSFGNSTNNLSTRYQYTGREKDEFTGLMYYRTRWYDANLGRFISEDPIGLGGGINQFTYVSNNSVNATDPTGLYEKDVHYYLTYYLAKRTGCYSESDSQEIARGDQGTDEDEDKYPGRGRTGPNAIYHALHPGASPGVGSSLLWDVATKPTPNNAYFGNYLHYLQDTYSHDGFYDSYWGHASVGHYFDKTDSDPDRAMQMAQSTWNALGNFAKEKGCECNSSMDSSTKGTVDLFNRTPGANFGFFNTIDSTGSYLDFGITNPSIYMQNKKRALGIY